jgi:hypothetical protein
MRVTPAGIVTLVSLVLAKASFAMMVTPAGIVTLLRLEHPLKASFSMLVTPVIFRYPSSSTLSQVTAHVPGSIHNRSK